MSSAIGRAYPNGRKHLTMLGQRAKQAVDDAGENLSPLTLTVFFVAPIVAAALFNVWIHVATVRLGYELSTAARDHESLVEENRGIRIEIATLKSPERLKRLATDNYKMAPPRPGQVVKLSGRMNK
jgi:cell division protein FtsL